MASGLTQFRKAMRRALGRSHAEEAIRRHDPEAMLFDTSFKGLKIAGESDMREMEEREALIPGARVAELVEQNPKALLRMLEHPELRSLLVTRANVGKFTGVETSIAEMAVDAHWDEALDIILADEKLRNQPTIKEWMDVPMRKGDNPAWYSVDARSTLAAYALSRARNPEKILDHPDLWDEPSNSLYEGANTLLEQAIARARSSWDPKLPIAIGLNPKAASHVIRHRDGRGPAIEILSDHTFADRLVPEIAKNPPLGDIIVKGAPLKAWVALGAKYYINSAFGKDAGQIDPIFVAAVTSGSLNGQDGTKSAWADEAGGRGGRERLLAMVAVTDRELLGSGQDRQSEAASGKDGEAQRTRQMEEATLVKESALKALLNSEEPLRALECYTKAVAAHKEIEKLKALETRNELPGPRTKSLRA